MKATFTTLSWPAAILLILGFVALDKANPTLNAGPKPETYWQVDDVRPGLKGYGRTVMKGTKVESFDVEVIGVLRNTNPGRDLILCRLSGLNLDKTGVIAGMSGSPVYINGKLLGAVAYAWPYGKEPIAGITPFAQMHSFVESFERRDLIRQTKAKRIGLKAPLRIQGKQYSAVHVAQHFDDAKPTAEDGLWMVPIRTPLVATGFTAHSLKLLKNKFRNSGLLPVQGGGVTARVADREKNTRLEVGGPMAVALITGDFDLSGIGTVTHIEGNRVYGWGHPFMGGGRCFLPLMTAYIHTIYPRQSVSFKMGSPLQTVGLVNADVSTCIAGWLNRKPEMMPVRTTVVRDQGLDTRTFNVRVAKQRSMMASLVFSVLTNSVDMEGDLPEQMTADLTAKIELDGQEPITIQDTYSGSSYSGGRAPSALYSPIAGLVNVLTNNGIKPVKIKRIECTTTIRPGRRSAEIEAIELDSETYAPGETVKATVFVRPFRGRLQPIRVQIRLPHNLANGRYTLAVCDDMYNARHELRDRPTLSSPQTIEQLLEGLRLQTSVKRTQLILRIPLDAGGVALNGKALPNLPASMVQIIGASRRTGAQSIGAALVARHETKWVIHGSETVRISVTKNKKTLTRE